MPNPLHDRILLTGFMGSGKTTVGRLLAKHLGWPFLDLDHEIEARTGLNVPAIFAQHGELHFRQLETETLADILQRHQIVLALGGGAIETRATRALLHGTPGTAIIHLEAPFDILFARCAQQAADPTATARPNLADPEAAAERHRNRRPHYDAVATHTVDVTTRDPAATLAAILQRLQA